MGISASVASIVVLGSIAAFQLQGPVDLSHIEQLTLTGALLTAVVVLWRALQMKDELLIANANRTAEALLAANETNRELRRVIEEFHRAVTRTTAV